MPHLNEWYEKYKDDGLVIIGVCTSRNGQEKYAETVEQVGFKFPTARDPELKTMSTDWVVMWFPTYALVDRKGVIRASGLLNKEGIEKAVRTLLAEDPPKKTEPGSDGGSEPQFTQTVEIPANVGEGSAERRETLSAMEGKAPPPLQVANWINTDPLTFENLTGKVVLIDYWATW